jgi:hypothetical protein
MSAAFHPALPTAPAGDGSFSRQSVDRRFFAGQGSRLGDPDPSQSTNARSRRRLRGERRLPALDLPESDASTALLVPDDQVVVPTVADLPRPRRLSSLTSALRGSRVLSRRTAHGG